MVAFDREANKLIDVEFDAFVLVNGVGNHGDHEANNKGDEDVLHAHKLRIDQASEQSLAGCSSLCGAAIQALGRGGQSCARRAYCGKQEITISFFI